MHAHKLILTYLQHTLINPITEPNTRHSCTSYINILHPCISYTNPNILHIFYHKVAFKITHVKTNNLKNFKHAHKPILTYPQHTYINPISIYNTQYPCTSYTNSNTLHILITMLSLILLTKERTGNLKNPYTCTQTHTYLP